MPFDALLAIQIAGHASAIEAMGRRVVAIGPGYRVVAETCQQVTAEGWAEWRIYATNLSAVPMPITLHWSWVPSAAALAGPVRIVAVVGPESVTARSIGRGEGTSSGLRIDGPPGAPIFDKVQFILPPFAAPDRELICVVAPCHPADFDGNGAVNALDFVHLLAAWGEPDGIADLDANGVVDAVDLSLFLEAWGT